MTESRIFDSFKVLGLVSTHVPCSVRYIYQRRQNFIITCSGRAINTYAGQELKQISMSSDVSADINCLATDTNHVYTAVSNNIFAYRRGTELQHKYEGGHESDVHILLPFADNLISVDTEGTLCVRNIKTEEIIKTIPFKNSPFTPTVLMHPLTFTNKILIGSVEGLIQLWNINTANLIHQCDTYKGSRINAIVQSPARGTVAIALSNKRIALHNIEYDQTTNVLECLDEPVSIAFRSDNTNIMVSGSSTGSITAWDLSSFEIICYLKEAHQLSVTGLTTFVSEPIMVSSSPDNSLKVWIFDKPDGGFRLLNSREGHRLEPNLTRFAGEKSLNLLTTGKDKCLRTFHIHNETYNRTISNYIPRSDNEEGRGVPVNFFTNSSGNHQPLAEDIVCFDIDKNDVHTFSFENCKRGKDLSLPSKKLQASRVCLTVNNEWAVVGFRSGEVQLFNLQSKLMRRNYAYLNTKKAHRGEVTGLAVNFSNTVLVSSGDRNLRFWDFKTCTFIKELSCVASVANIFSQASSNLFGVILGNFNLLVCDLNTKDVVRELKGGTDHISSACFSPDMKWVTASFYDGTVRTWDVPTSDLIDVFRISDGIITSLDYSPNNGDFLATTISGQLGIYLWINKTVYEHVSLLPISIDCKPEDVDADVEFVESDSETEDDPSSQPTSEQSLHDLDDLLLSLGKMYTYGWRDLLQVDDIKERNKPAQKVHKENVPFILSSMEQNTESERIRWFTTGNTQTQQSLTEPPKSKIIDLQLVLSPFGKKLSESTLTLSDPCEEDCKELIRMLEVMGPSQLNVEIRSLGPDEGGSIKLLEQFLQFVRLMMVCRQHMQITQMCFALFLKVFREVIESEKSLVILLKDLFAIQEETRKPLENRFTRVSGLAEFVSKDLF